MDEKQEIAQTGIVKSLMVQIKIVIERDGDGFHVYSPDLKGLHTCGDTEEEAVQNAKDAVSAYLLSLIKHDELDKIMRTVKG